MKLSLCIATFNEEANIHYPLDSAYDLVDEIIIVDGGSTDKTVEIAKSYDDKSTKGRSPSGRKVKVLRENYVAMFHVNKQKALDKAKGEWILQLDADEALSEELKKEIAIVIASEAKQSQSIEKIASSSSTPRNDKIVAFNIPRKNFFLTRFLTKGGQYPDYTIRLYKNGSVRFPCKSVHENVELIDLKSTVDSLKSQIGYLKSPILHYADPTFSRYLQRWDRYTSMDAELLRKNLKSQISNLKSFAMFLDYFFIKPKVWFLNTYFRHKGFMDGFPGFVFCLFSSIRFWVIYVKWWQKYKMS